MSTLRYCPSCQEWHTTPYSTSADWRCDKCMEGASLAVLWWWTLFAVVACAIAAWFCFA